MKKLEHRGSELLTNQVEEIGTYSELPRFKTIRCHLFGS